MHPQRAIDDLAWVVTSPPLVRHDRLCPDSAWFHRAGLAFQDHLAALRQDPTPLVDHLARRRDRRLGAYFECLFGYWLGHGGDFELLAHDLPVRDAGRTLGALDFLARHRDSATVWHWEVACKFYLGDGDPTDVGSWIGPGRRDTLEAKLRHTLEHQVRLSEHPAVRDYLAAEHGVATCRQRVCIKGRLFYPLSGSRTHWPECVAGDHPYGVWGTAAQWRARWETDAREWLVLPRQGWLAPLTGALDGQPLRLTEAIERVAGGSWPLCLVRLRDGRERERGFLVPDGWSRGDHSTRRWESPASRSSP